MYDVTLVKEILKQILWSSQTIASRFAPITSPDDFINSDRGREKLDAICMQLIAVGENIKNLDKVTEGELLPKYDGIDWKRIMGMRDVISHHYFDIDAEIVHAVCETYIEELTKTVESILKDLDEENKTTS